MANRVQSPLPDSHNVIGASKGGSIRGVCKAYKSLVTTCCYTHPSSDKPHPAEYKRKEDLEALSERKQEAMNGIHDFTHSGERIRGCGACPVSPGGFNKHPSVNKGYLTRSASEENLHNLTPDQSFLLKAMNRRSIDAAAAFAHTSSLPARRSTSTTPIMFSYSNGLKKPPAMEKKLECTLEELCFGCKRKIKITRDVLTEIGQIIQEEEMLTIKVKPGWKKGTKITFEGIGDERPGTYPADIIFLIEEKQHRIFTRDGDDLELVVEVPLIEALTGCTLSIPLLGGEKMSLTIDDIIYPGYEKIIEGQGMPNSKEQGKRANLRIVFLIEFPTELTEEQRFDVFSILQDSC